MSDAPGPVARTAPIFRDSALFRPGSVVLVADPEMPEAALLARNLGGGGFHGRIFAVGLDGAGFEPVASIAELPVAPDLAVLCLPAERLEAAMAALAARGCRAGIVIGAAPALAAMVARTGLRALGQGSFGLAVPAIGLNATLAPVPPLPGRLALVAQSGALTRAVLDWAGSEGIGFSHVIGVGGNALMGFATALDWLARDPATGAVLLELRVIRDRRAFVSAARAAARTRPVVALRAGGRLADPTGRADQVLDAVLARAGVLRVSGLEDLLGAAETLARCRLRPGGGDGDRIAIVTNGRGLGLLAADAVLAGDGTLAVPAPQALAGPGMLGVAGDAPGNPLVLAPEAGARLAQAAAALAGLAEVDCVLALHAPPLSADPDAAGATSSALIDAARAGGGGRAAPILVGWTGAPSQRQVLAQAGLAVFDTPEAAVRGAMHLAQDRRNRRAAAELPAREVLEVRPDHAAAGACFAAMRAAGRLAATDAEALDVLAAYGVPVVPGRVAAGPVEAADASAMLGFPVVLKILSPDIADKSEVGGVVLGLGSAEAVAAAAAAMLARVRAQRPAARIDGFLVQRQAARAIELRLRLDDDPMFGPWIGFGQGGTAADLAADEAIDLPPLNLALADRLLEASRAGRLLRGWRDLPAANRGAVAATLVRLSQLAVDFPEIARVTINPLFADADGVLAVDARLVLRPAGEVGALAILPYPGELAAPFTLGGGEVVAVRPIRPEDAQAHAELFARLSPEDVRWRFFAPIREMAPALIARLTQIDYGRELAFVATRAQAGAPDRTLGIARLIREPGGDRAEFAVVVDPALKGQGLGRHLMGRIIDWGGSVGVREVVGQVLADNVPMLAFARALGFTLRRSMEDAEVMEARLQLGGPTLPDPPPAARATL